MGQKHLCELLNSGIPSTLNIKAIDMSLSSFEKTFLKLFAIPLYQNCPPPTDVISTDLGVFNSAR